MAKCASVLREIRTRLHLSQAECAAALGVAVETFRTWDAGRRPASHVRNVSTATPRAAAHSAWERWSRVRISLRTEAHLAIGHDDAIGPPLAGSEWTALRIRRWRLGQKWARN